MKRPRPSGNKPTGLVDVRRYHDETARGPSALAPGATQVEPDRPPSQTACSPSELKARSGLRIRPSVSVKIDGLRR